MSMHILLAEDNEANRMLVRSLLEREGHSLDFSQNGSIALLCCEDTKYDLILMDILMPVMDGVKALRKLRRSNGLNSKTPVFALTAYSSQADRKRYLQVGFNLVLSKPLRPNELAQAWNNYLKGDPNIAFISTDSLSQDFENIPFIDESIAGELLISGSPDEIRLIVERFWESARHLMSLIHENLSSAMRDQHQALSALRGAVHGIKGAAATIGLMRLSRIAATLQNAPPDKIASLVLIMTETISPSAELLEKKINAASDFTNTDFVVAHFGDADEPKAPNQIQPSLSESQSPHRISTVKALPPQALTP